MAESMQLKKLHMHQYGVVTHGGIALKEFHLLPQIKFL